MKILILAILSFSLFISGCKKSLVVDKFDIYTTEGWIACVVAAAGQSNPQPDKPDASECTCKGTGKVKTGDGLNETQCPCGDKCECGKTSVSKNKKRCILLTSPKNCPPCKAFDKKVIPQLKKYNWTFGNRDTLVEVVECDLKDGKWSVSRDDINKLLNDNKIDVSAEGIPFFILLDKEKVIETKAGISSAQEFTDFFYQTGK